MGKQHGEGVAGLKKETIITFVKNNTQNEKFEHCNVRA